MHVMHLESLFIVLVVVPYTHLMINKYLVIQKKEKNILELEMSMHLEPAPYYPFSVPQLLLMVSVRHPGHRGLTIFPVHCHPRISSCECMSDAAKWMLAFGVMVVEGGGFVGAVID